MATEDSTHILAVLAAFLSPNDIIRRESQLWLDTTTPQIVILQLLDALETAADIHIRSLASTLLKSRIEVAWKTKRSDSNESVYATLICETVAPRILTGLVNETDKTVRNQLSGAVALIADLCYSEGEWVELWQLIGQWLGNPGSKNTVDVTHRMTAMTLLNHLGESPRTLQFLERHIQDITQFLGQSLNQSSLFDETRLGLELIATIEQAIASNRMESVVVAKALHSKSGKPLQFGVLKKALRSLVPSILVVLEDIINCHTSTNQREEDLKSVLNIISEITDADLLFWVGFSRELFELMCRIVLAGHRDFHLRQSSLYIVVRAAGGCVHRATKIRRGSLQPGSTEAAMLQQAEAVADAICDICRSLLTEAVSFVEAEGKWECRREDEPVDSDAEDILEALCSLIADYIQQSASPIADARLLTMAVNLFTMASTPASTVVGLRIISELISERPDSVEPSADALLIRLFSCLNVHYEGKGGSASDNRCRWWCLMVMCDLFGAYAPTLQLSRSAEVLSCLCTAIRSDPVIRCKCRAMTALYSFLAPLEDGAAFELVEGFVEPLLKDIVIPAVQTDHDELMELGFSVATAVAGVSGKSFAKYRTDCIKAVIQSAQKPRNGLVLNGKKQFHICDAAIGLAAKLISDFPAEGSLSDFHFLSEALLNVAASVAKGDDVVEASSVSLRTVLSCLTALSGTLGDGFAPYVQSYASCIFGILSHSDAPEIIAGNSVVGIKASVDLASGVVGKVAVGQAECKEEGGVTQFCVKGKDGEHKVIEFKTQIIDEKVAALECLIEVLPSIGKHWVTWIPQTLAMLKSEISSNYDMIRQPALELSSILLASLLPDSEDTVDRTESKCALAVGAISIGDFYHAAAELMTYLLTSLKQYRASRAAEVIPVVEEILRLLYEANLLTQIQQDERTAMFIEFVFQEFGKLLAVTIQQELVKQNDVSTAQSESASDENEDSWTDGTSDSGDSEEDFEGIIYGGIMRSVKHIMKVFDSLKCTELFMAHLDTPFAGLLTLSEVNIVGRSAALCVFAILLEYGSPSVRHEIATAILPTAILYSHCNDLPTPLKEKIQSGVSTADDVYDEDVERLQAAAYCLGVVATTAPQILLEHFATVIQTLQGIINHPQARADERRLATESAVSALIKICTAPMLRQDVVSMDPSDQMLEGLLTVWLPLSDKDESRTITDLLVNFVLENRIPQLVGKCNIQLDKALSLLESPKDKIARGKLADAQSLLHSTAVTRGKPQ